LNASIKSGVTAMAENIKQTMRKRILLHNTWMSEATKASAVEKLDLLKLLIAYPEEWTRDYSPLFGIVSQNKTFLENRNTLYIVVKQTHLRSLSRSANTLPIWKAFWPYTIMHISGQLLRMKLFMGLHFSINLKVRRVRKIL
jgi:predicted metalloendopeptidase